MGGGTFVYTPVSLLFFDNGADTIAWHSAIIAIPFPVSPLSILYSVWSGILLFWIFFSIFLLLVHWVQMAKCNSNSGFRKGEVGMNFEYFSVVLCAVFFLMANHHCSSLIGLLLSGSFDRLDREETCYRCLFIAQKHANVLQYKECKFSFISFLNSAFNSNFNSISMNPSLPLFYI